MPRKVRALIAYLKHAGFREIRGGGIAPQVRSPELPGAVTLSGHTGDDAKAYQEKQVERAIKVANEED